MDYPKITREGSYRLHIPELSGGLNRVDPLDTVRDNQLTDCKNVWFKDGVLQSRPALRWIEEDGGPADPDDPDSPNRPWLVPPDGSTLKFRGEVGGVFRMVYLVTGQAGGKDTLYVFYVRRARTVQEKEEGKEVVVGHSDSFSPCDAETFGNVILFESEPINGIANSDGLYALVYDQNNGTTVWGHSTNRDTKWWQIPEDADGVYAPLVLINGKGNKYSALPSGGNAEYPRAVTFEGFNTLFGKFRAGFFADGVSHEFQLPSSLAANSKVEVTYTNRKNEIYTWEIPKDASDSGPPLIDQDNIQAHVNRKTGLLWFTAGKEGQAPGTLAMVQGVSNSILVTAVADISACTLGNSTRAIWFGGSANGINGGSRLFLTGDSKSPGKVCWSDQGRPLYFPENCYAYVGESGRPVTAMAKQDDMLVFFKENETYYTTYVDGPSYTADDILSGAIVDVTAVDAVFPIYQISPNIGCDQPDTIQNCDNRLIWASSPGHVYTLVSSSIYSNANIYRLTDETGPLLDTAGIAKAGILDGWYYLFQGDTAYVMDYRTNAVRGVTSYAKDRSPVGWYVWKFTPTGPTAVGVLSSEIDGLLLISKGAGQNGNNHITGGLFEDGTEDAAPGLMGLTIKSRFRTKLFDFGYPERMKKIAALVLKAGGNGYMDVAFDTERGQTPCIRHKDFYSDAGAREPGYLRSVKFAPVAPRVQQFGLSIQAAGRFALGGVSLYYKPMR